MSRQVLASTLLALLLAACNTSMRTGKVDAGTDLATAPDSATAPDLATTPDLAPRPDSATTPDASSEADSAIPEDLAAAPKDAGRDLGSGADLPTTFKDGGTCPPGQYICGLEPFARCYDLQTDPVHCGACDNSCTAGIACAGGACQQAACTGYTSFSRNPTSTEMSEAVSSILADINGDGWLDSVSWTRDYNSPMIKIFQVSLGLTEGGFGTPSTYQSVLSIQFISAGDYNGDDKADLYVNSSDSGAQCVEVWLGQSDGTLTPAKDPKIQSCLNTITIGDINGDGITDLATPKSYGSGISVYLSDDKGELQLSQEYEAGEQIYNSVFLDWNGDGSPDIVASGIVTLKLYFNNGDGTFAPVQECGVSSGGPSGQPVFADFNHDGNFDMAYLGSRSVMVLLGMGECRFQPVAEYPLLSYGVGLAKADMNGDGQMDLVVLDGSDVLTVMIGSPDGTFKQETVDLGGGEYTHTSMVVGETSRDGRPDIVVVSKDGTVQVVENTCE